MKGELLKEFLSRILVEDGPADELNDIELTYTDKDGKEKTVKVKSIRAKGSEHPAWPQYQTLLQQRGIVDTDPGQGGRKKKKKSPADGQSQSIVKPLIQPTSTGTTDTTSSTDDTDTQVTPSDSVTPEELKHITDWLTDRKKSAPSLNTAIDELVTAIESRDKSKIRAVVDTYGISMSTGGMLQIICPEGKWDGEKCKSRVSSADRKLGYGRSSAPGKREGANIKDKLSLLGVNLPGGGGISQNAFKPMNMYKTEDGGYPDELPEASTGRVVRQGGYITSIELDGVTVRGIGINPNDPQTKTDLIAENVNEIIASRRQTNPNYSDEEAKEEAEEIIQYYHQQTLRLTVLNRAIKTGQLRKLPEGEEGMRFIAEHVNRTLLDEKGKPLTELQDAIDSIAEARNTEEFEQRWDALSNLLMKNKKHFGPGAVPTMLEALSSMKCLLEEKTTYAILNDSFSLVDVISVNPKQAGEPISDVKAMFKSFELIKTSIDGVSTKYQAGGASAFSSWIATSRYREHEKTIEALNHLAGGPRKVKQSDGTTIDHPGAHNEIWNANKEELKKIKDETVKLFDQYGTQIRRYYGYPQEGPPTDEEIIEQLSSGNRPGCGQTGSAPNQKFKTKCRGQTDEGFAHNKNQLSLYSLRGFMFEAIYNSNLLSQGFNNESFKKNKIDKSDGISRLAMAKFQFNKQLNCKNWGPNKTPTLKDDALAGNLHNKNRGWESCPSK